MPAAGAVTGVPATLEVAESQEEFFGAEMRGSLLRRIAEETGGRFYTPRTVKDVAQAIEKANDSPYGLQAGIFTRDIDTAFRVVRALEVIALTGEPDGLRRHGQTKRVEKEMNALLRDASRIDPKNIQESLSGLRAALRRLDKRPD